MPSLSAMLSLHSKTAALALLPLLIWGTYRALEQERGALRAQSIEIAVEHQDRAALAITRSIGGSQHLIDVTNESAELLYVSLPESWTRDEVRNVPLASITADAPSLGYRRWHVPPRATITFRAVDDWRQMTVHNPSGTLLKLRVTTVDLARDIADTEAYLIQEESLDVRF